MPETPAVPTVLRHSVSVLTALGEAGPMGLDAAEVALLTGLNSRTVYRHLSSLKTLGLVADAAEPTHVRLGPAIASLAQNASDQREFLRRAREFCTELAERTQEPVHVTVFDQGTAVTVASATREAALAEKSPPIVLGSRRPLHASASGKLFLAYNPQALQAYAVRGLESLTPFTIVSLEELQRECLQIREQGWSRDRQEYQLGVTCVAVPVHGTNGRAIGALAVSTKQPVMSLEHRTTLLRALRPAAAEFTQAIGGSSRPPD